MSFQTEIDFTRRVENNSFSQSLLDGNSDHLNNQCKIVLSALMRGERLTVKGAMMDYDISHLPRRIKDLKEFMGIDVKTKTLKGRFVEYYLERN